MCGKASRRHLDLIEEKNESAGVCVSCSLAHPRAVMRRVCSFNGPSLVSWAYF